MAVPDSLARVYSIVDGKSAHICIRPAGDRACHRLTTRDDKWEAGGVISPDGRLVAYSAADAPLTRSEVWVSRLDGGGARRVSGADEDALMPAFADGHRLLYMQSGAFGHASPIASSRRHKFDVMSVSLDDSGAASGQRSQLTHQELYDVSSIATSPDGKRFLLCLFRYPIGSVLEEYDIDKPLQIKATYQPHVIGEVSSGSIFGGAAYVHDGLDIVFTAATGGFEFDYNVYQVSAVTGGEIVALTHGKGMIESFNVDRDGSIHFIRDGHGYRVDPKSRAQSNDDY
jgi:hypothetical protein